MKLRLALGPDDFAGLWRISRVITDRLGRDGEFCGTAAMRSYGADQLLYHEYGQLTLGEGPPMTAERKYHWRFVADRVSVSFASGEPFHAFVAGGHVDGTDHPCGDDLYRVRYDFRRWPAWQAVWTVSGPRKDYTSVTAYVPAGATATRLARQAGVGH